MAKYKGVWFSESNPTKWFEQSKDAENFDKAAEVVDFIRKCSFMADGGNPVAAIVDRIMERYTIEQRYDYIPPAGDEDEHEADAI